MDNILTIDNLHTHFTLDDGVVRAVQGLHLAIPRGGTVCLVGESGCGKSVAALSVLRLISPPGKIVEGKVTLYRPEGPLELTALEENANELRKVRGKDITMVFQEPMTSFSPVYTIGNQLLEAVRLHLPLRKTEAKAHVLQVMERAEIPDAARRFDQFPHELSGGLRQRAMIAMALACHPSLLIADEPTTALDVTIQAQVLALLRDLQQETGMSILLITHDFGVVAEIAQQVAVMYLGVIIEQAEVGPILKSPLHPYTKALLQAIPGNVPRKSELKVIPGMVPDPFIQLAGCPFHPRCEACIPGRCDRGKPPALVEVEPGHQTACHLYASEQHD